MTLVFYDMVRKGDKMSVRFEKAMTLIASVRPASHDGLYFVKSATNPNQEYAVRVGRGARCDCRDFRYRGVVCKHQLAVLEFERRQETKWMVEYYTFTNGRASIEVVAKTREEAIEKARRARPYEFDRAISAWGGYFKRGKDD